MVGTSGATGERSRKDRRRDSASPSRKRRDDKVSRDKDLDARKRKLR